MREIQCKQVLSALADLIAWYGEEQLHSYLTRLKRAERLVRRIDARTMDQARKRVEEVVQ